MSGSGVAFTLGMVASMGKRHGQAGFGRQHVGEFRRRFREATLSLEFSVASAGPMSGHPRRILKRSEGTVPSRDRHSPNGASSTPVA